MARMRDTFEGVGQADTAGIWQGAPNLRPEFRALNLKKIEKKRRAEQAQEMI
jgi:chlorophyllide a reductase subunit Y